MTSTSAPFPWDPAGRWLTAQRDVMRDGVAGILDVEAGLREALIHARHGDVVRGLGAVLDIEAGLTAILPTPTPPETFEPALPAPADAQHELHRRINAIAPQTRLTIRRHRLVGVGILARNIARNIDLARETARERAHDQAFSHAPDIVRDLASDLTHALEHAHALADDIARAHHYPHDAASHDLARTSDLVRNLTRDLTRARQLARQLANDLVLVGDAQRALALTSALGDDISRAHDYARDLAHDTAKAVAGLLELAPADGLTPELIYDLLDDFTTADMSAADLSGIDLEGVRWSEQATRWPPAMDIEQLKRDSEETPPKSGIYVVRPGTVTAKDDLVRA